MQNPNALFSARGAAYSQGVCAVCGTKLTRWGATELHAGIKAEGGTLRVKDEGRTAAADQLPTAAKRARAVPKSKIENGVLSKAKDRKSKIGGQPSAVGGRLVIVESPAKARTVGKFLGAAYRVRASIGHIRDLPERQMGVDIERDFRPHYVITPKKRDVVKELKELAGNASEIFLATDPDREGEAISWHLVAALDNALEGKPVQRVEFHEITRDAIDRAFANPRAINQQLVDAQQARRVLDRLVGYTISPLLRKKIKTRNLSAGRVQSVAVRLVVEREREIQAFVAVEYWSIEAELQKRTEDGRPMTDARLPSSVVGRTFRAKLIKIGDKDFECHAGADALKLKEVLEQCAYTVLDVRRKDERRNPSPPFITSTMQQDASRKLGFNAKRTMAIAQQLYEGIALGDEGSVGLITYMRTDSTNVAESAGKEAWAYVKQKFGEEYLPPTPRVYKKKVAGAQEAHEAIRPTSVFREPDALKQFLDADQFKLYDLIWKRFVASQMASAVFDTTAVDIGANRPTTDDGRPKPPSSVVGHPSDFLFRANGSILKFRGFLAVYKEGKDDAENKDDEANRVLSEVEGKILPPLARDEPLDLLGIFPEQHFTQPPARYTEATLIKALEEKGIGRPSTYAPILSTIQERFYVERLPDRKLKPTDLGFIVNDLLVKHFPNEVDIGFTAQMETQLDKVAEGEANWVQVLRDFYAPFKQTLDRAASEMPEVTLPVETTNEVCDKCGAPMIVKRGRFGKFLACSKFPECKNTRTLRVSASGGSANTGVRCPECKQGEIVEKKSKKGRIFFSCNRYPACKFALWDKPVKTPCPRCGKLMTLKGKNGVKCTQCDYTGEIVLTEN
ncbi:MAG: type I DNA topoisomerase [Chloroflexi bacterium]|nr:type I DNA topoisomerase [Chloroflexota bacterium]